jgi:hypothetical protein
MAFVPVANGKPKGRAALEKLDVKGICFERIVMPNRGLNRRL